MDRKFRCDTGQCIDFAKRCDRTGDCLDNSDELDCGKMSIIPNT